VSTIETVEAEVRASSKEEAHALLLQEGTQFLKYLVVAKEVEKQVVLD
jgi:hypothetical protein